MDGTGRLAYGSEMDIRVLLGIAGGCAAVAGFAGWRGARPPDLSKGPRLIPWRAIMVVLATVAVACLGMAARMAGVNPPGR